MTADFALLLLAGILSAGRVELANAELPGLHPTRAARLSVGSTEVGRLGEVDVPSVVVGGIADRIVSVGQHRAAADGLGADLHLLEGAGHAPHEQRPEAVADIIGDFVGGL